MKRSVVLCLDCVRIALTDGTWAKIAKIQLETIRKEFEVIWDVCPDCRERATDRQIFINAIVKRRLEHV